MANAANWRARSAKSRARERWTIEELHTEEGRLDEVFRNITRPETKQEKSRMSEAILEQSAAVDPIDASGESKAAARTRSGTF